MLLSRNDFPEDFLFGTATSSYQIEGHSFGGAGRTHFRELKLGRRDLLAGLAVGGAAAVVLAIPLMLPF